ncbi:PPC domain-containing protein [Geobacillus sp. DSP4a]|uniref:PPC domain-containing protein n=1 Tax=Geobacillus sp. DSP4a TaxID=2508873 RepID=UPI00067D7D2C|nr:PPC domain-containing protein [Geobacillus sp. DSP4a]AKU26415.1 hypothetical protein IB49_08065 [Geobacillus sp. LC300]NNV00865.1 hypothetical protein [Geobacillus sp. DSP4a]
MKKWISGVMTAGLLFSSAIFAVPSVAHGEGYETEDNGSMANATPITVNDTYRGILRDNSDVDYYKFSLNQPGLVTFSLPNKSQSGDRIKISIVDKNGNTLADLVNDPTSAYDMVKNSVGLAAGDYFVKVEYYDYVENEPYSFTLSFKPGNTYEQEPNENLAEATLVNVNNTIEGVIENDDDKDYYKIILRKPGKLSFTMLNDGPDKEISILTKDHDTLAYLYTDNTSAYDSYTGSVGLPAGEFYIKVARSDYYPSNSPYQFKLTFKEGLNYEQEFNNSLRTANPVKLNSNIEGFIQFGDYGDDDYYKITIPQPTKVKVLLSNTGESKYVSIYDKDNNQLTSFWINPSTDYDGYYKEIGLNRGEYYILIEGEERFDQYILTITAPKPSVWWGKVKLVKGQIGKVTVLKDTYLWKMDAKGKLTSVRKLKKGEELRVYSYKNGLYGVGGGYYVKKDAAVKYETPSKTKLKQLEEINKYYN